MPANIHIGNCGWSYINDKNYSHLLTKKYSSKLQAYAQLFDIVEINSTFYSIPRLTTVEKWFCESKEINPKFNFTVKANKNITHLSRFGRNSIEIFDNVKEICQTLKSKIVLFQSPESFLPSKVNIKKLEAFFSSIKRENLILAWEPRGKWYERTELISKVCSKVNLIHCVDPLRNKPLYFGNESVAYFRLHGFGKPSIYNYQFSKQELMKIYKIVKEISRDLSDIFIFFNNSSCYDDSLAFKQFINENI